MTETGGVGALLTRIVLTFRVYIPDLTIFGNKDPACATLEGLYLAPEIHPNSGMPTAGLGFRGLGFRVRRYVTPMDTGVKESCGSIALVDLW